MIETSELQVHLDDGVLRIPYVRVVGEAGGGPHLTLIAGVHGTEYTSIAAARELLTELRPAELSGTVTVAPVGGPSLVLHGGAGALARELSPEERESYAEGLVGRAGRCFPSAATRWTPCARAW
jgi:hypothetical protein